MEKKYEAPKAEILELKNQILANIGDSILTENDETGF